MYSILKTQGVLPLVTQINIETAQIIVRSAADAGIKIIEFAARSNDSKEVFSQMVNFKKANNLNIKIAVGSILTIEDAETYHKLGADCIVCPHTDLEIGNYCIKNNIYWIPGAATLNEILYANKQGAEIVKLFPADKIGGPGYVKAIKAPFPNLKIMPTGGVTLEESNLKSWFKSGVVCVGIGSNLFSKEMLQHLTYDQSLEAFQNLIEIIEKIRN
ncbi:bifunctional 4-hydroxy-2-oxoglutarate aldolase/2-dehydro-3-deoxy-phosphogluconate aldolase [Flavobacterium sp. 2]|uniref:bifunctional 4-hydroxy-2-oxoglutarate aldolase/2-dehydro-3-deoxy-phosphogluconate aldolase n=1 Tax=Flavobacterium sp. 2 TaxID=308053 RepID=UPI000C18EC13|nr:aldolase [Flavobacterium sp. 2]PIF70068.1 2-keto-3-deoxy-phosphogluconate aldolase [Flavobacterium sp. 2]